MKQLHHSTSVFTYLDQSQIQEIVAQYGSPCFIVDEESLLARAVAFRDTVTSCYENSRVACSVKTQPLAGLVRRLYATGYIPEVVSSDEFALINELDLLDQGIIFNGPYKTDEALIRAIRGNARINCDHFDEVLRIARLAENMNVSVDIGLRIVDVNDSANWLRFGFGIDDVDANAEIVRIIDQIEQMPALRFAGIHCHIGTNIRALSRFRRMSRNIAALAELVYQRYGRYLDWIDVGGGLAGVSPRWEEDRILPYPPACLTDYVEAVFRPLEDYLLQSGRQTELIFEPGRTLFDMTTALIANIVGCRDRDTKTQTLIVNAGIHTLPTTRTYRHPVYWLGSDNPVKTTTLLGPSCMQHDVISNDASLPDLSYGDYILIDCIGAYNSSRNNAFIHLMPAIVLITRENDYQLLRKKPASFLSERQG